MPPSFDCGGDGCGGFSCRSCFDDEAVAHYWAVQADAVAHDLWLKARAARPKLLERLLKEAAEELQALVDYDPGRNYGGHYNVDDARALLKRIKAVLK
jgi:hypothetical protein